MVPISMLPPEIQLIILRYCDFPSLLQMRQVSTYYKWLVEHELYSKHRLDVTCDYFDIFESYNKPICLNMEDGYNAVCDKIVIFLKRYMPNLRDLSLRDCAIVLTLKSLIQLALAVPHLYKLDLSQICGKPFFEKNAVLALPYFRQLKVLIMDGFVARKTTGRGCSYRLEVPPIYHMQHLEVLEMDCPHDTLSNILHSLREVQCILYNLKRVNVSRPVFGVKHCSAMYPELLIWFLLTHRALRSVRIYNALFATTDQLRRFYNALISLPNLTELHLESCTLCDQIDSSIQLQFITNLKSRGVFRKGMVRSMRYDPDNGH